MDVIELLAELFLVRGVPGYIRSDNGPELVAKAVQGWLAAVGAQTAYITPGSPWENGYIESFNARLRDELLDGEIFFSLEEARIVIENWRRHYNAVRPHGALRYRAPAPEVLMPGWAAWPGGAAGGLWTSGQPGSAGLTTSPQAQEQSILTVLPTNSPDSTMEPRPAVN